MKIYAFYGVIRVFSIHKCARSTKLLHDYFRFYSDIYFTDEILLTNYHK